MAHEVGIHCESLFRYPGLQSLGIVRKQLGLKFEGETREHGHILLADFELKGLSREASDLSNPDLVFN